LWRLNLGDLCGKLMNIGPYNVKTILAGTFRLDGGAMFGSVSRTLWERKNPADSLNRIELATRLLWLEDESSSRRILVDAGNGNKFDQRTASIFDLQENAPESWGIAPDEVTDVVLTHLHFDHAGGMTRRSESGELGLVFPNARVHVQRENWDNARQPWDRERASYLEENWGPLEEKGDLHLLDGPTSLFDEVTVELAHGHSRGLQWIKVGDGRGAVAYPSDLIPTASHIHLPWIMGYDRCAQTTFEEKEAFLNRAVDEEWVVVFEHDPTTAAATIKRDDRGRCVIDQVVDV
jgi:glyoxylase-like metal-dependent hydrolase (beta-lactamase superfamily II)